MHITYNAATANVSDTNSSLAEFYNLAGKLSSLRSVRLTAKADDADCIEWTFTYRKQKVTLQYSIYNGISLLYDGSTDKKIIYKLADKLHLK